MSTQPPFPGGSSPDPTRSWLTTPTPPPTPSNPTTATPTTPLPPPTPPAKIKDAITAIKPADFLAVHRSPCSQQGFLTGIGAGAGIGILRWVIGLPAPRAANWAVGTGALAALVQYEWCQYGRRVEREKMVRMVEVYTARQAREKAEVEERRAAEERERARKEEEGRKRGWRFW
ncbi:hypothetical protein B0T25DRAFT_519302 [Lasiosphaeria hispida]|uniref:Cytochrome c oxidase assembly protein COX20, mitochondrial n=1 Tax=Lasiosphaeria hispida TaxID=260671 RepID=A0AAJ0HDQ1_9PEZI|nr:hypothetical protein B0T25DRAFT_519302 [Lasiosphaeria hispida]